MNDCRRHYRENDLLTASQKKLIITLYDACLRHINQAVEQFPAQRGKEIKKIHHHISSAQDILTELMASLNFDHGGHIAANLYQLYRYFYRELVRANIEKQVSPLHNVYEQLSNLRSAWTQMEEPAPTLEPGPTGGLDLSG